MFAMLYTLYLRKPGKAKTDTETMGEQRTQDETNILKTVEAFTRKRGWRKRFCVQLQFIDLSLSKDSNSTRVTQNYSPIVLAQILILDTFS